MPDPLQAALEAYAAELSDDEFDALTARTRNPAEDADREFARQLFARKGDSK